MKNKKGIITIAENLIVVFIMVIFCLGVVATIMLVFKIGGKGINNAPTSIASYTLVVTNDPNGDLYMNDEPISGTHHGNGNATFKVVAHSGYTCRVFFGTDPDQLSDEGTSYSFAGLPPDTIEYVESVCEQNPVVSVDEEDGYPIYTISDSGNPVFYISVISSQATKNGAMAIFTQNGHEVKKPFWAPGQGPTYSFSSLFSLPEALASSPTPSPSPGETDYTIEVSAQELESLCYYVGGGGGESLFSVPTAMATISPTPSSLYDLQFEFFAGYPFDSDVPLTETNFFQEGVAGYSKPYDLIDICNQFLAV